MIYRQLSAQMRDSLKSIYQQLSALSAGKDVHPIKTEMLFKEASSQLGEIVKTTETAAMDIMNIVENQLEAATESNKIIDNIKKGIHNSTDINKLAEINENLQTDLISILTALSFQDITGQRIKKFESMLDIIEKNIAELYISTGLVMYAAEHNPEVDEHTTLESARQAVEEFSGSHNKTRSELKGPDSRSSQGDIDNMLAQLGL